MTFIEPLELKTILIQIFSGSQEIFTAVAILFIMGFAGYLRMTGLGMFFMLAVFFLMFAEVIPFSLFTLIAIIGGLLIGYILANITTR
jgi:hypothetical protein